ncbi:MAG TPA: oligosaccharide flippase family protein, partial [Kofleriaceae bacterium]
VTAEVAFPAFARLHADRRRAGELLLRFTRQNAIALVPVVIFLAVAADDLLAVLYPPLPPAATMAARILCVVGALRMLSFVLPAMLAGLGHAADSLVYHALAAILLPIAFAVSAHVFPSLSYVSVALAWAAVYPLVFLVLLGRALSRCHVTVSAYLRSLAGISCSGLVAAIAGTLVHAWLHWPPLAHLLATAAVIAAVYLALLARLEHVTPRSLLRSMRA